MLKRNPIVVLGTTAMKTIGDTHLGKVFKNNILLHRRGEFEKTQVEKLKEEISDITMFDLENTNEYLRCQVGDWFDKSVVSNQAVLTSYEILKTYEENDSTPLLIISGNHDDSKSLSEPTSWDILSKFFIDSNTIKFIKDWHVHTTDCGKQILFVGWNISNGVAVSFLQAVEAGFNNIRMVVCHLDRISYGDETNVIPYDFLKEKGVECVVSGHEHKPYFFNEGGMQIIGTGSLLPYNHAEDPEDEHFITFKSLESLLDFGIANLVDKHVRIYTDQVEYIPELDCLSLQIHKMEALTSEEDFKEVIIESYNAKSVFEAAAKETGLSIESTKILWDEISIQGCDE